MSRNIKCVSASYLLLRPENNSTPFCYETVLIRTLPLYSGYYGTSLTFTPLRVSVLEKPSSDVQSVTQNNYRDYNCLPWLQKPYLVMHS
jgi:hypothetical protein